MKSDLYLPGELSAEPWMGGTRHKFTLNGCTAWIVEPEVPRQQKNWFWLPEWPDAFPKRNGVRELLQMGFYMLHINVFGKYANEEALSLMHSLYEYAVSLGFARKGALIGMSLGGLYSFRYAQKYPETVTCIYADAPVCDLHYRSDLQRDDAVKISSAYGYGDNTEALLNHSLSPVNHYQSIVAAGIPLLLILGLDDNVVDPQRNGLLLAERWRNAGGKVEIISRPSWGHHPHGLDNPLPIVRFIMEHTRLE